MEIFEYKAKDQAGKTFKGRIEAADEKKAVALLRDQKLVVIDLKPRRENLSLLYQLKKLQGISEADKATFTRLLATMIETGLPITDALSNLALQIENPRFKEIVNEILRDVEGGSSLSSAMARHKDVFSDIYISLIKTGEAAGNLDKTLARLADSLEKERAFKGKIKSALLYPAIVTVMMIGVGALMMMVVVPKIADVYQEANAQLPLPTLMMISLSAFIKNSWYFLVGFFVLMAFVLRALKKTKQGSQFMSNLAFKIPIFGELNRQVTLASLVRTLGVLIASGVAILEALRLTTRTLGQNAFRESLEQAIGQVEKGFPLSATLRASEVFPPIMGQMIMTGEETGTLDEILDRLSNYFEQESAYLVRNLTTAMEPLIIVILGVAVAGLAIAVLMPLFNLVNVIR